MYLNKKDIKNYITNLPLERYLYQVNNQVEKLQQRYEENVEECIIEGKRIENVNQP